MAASSPPEVIRCDPGFQAITVPDACPPSVRNSSPDSPHSLMVPSWFTVARIFPSALHPADSAWPPAITRNSARGSAAVAHTARSSTVIARFISGVYGNTARSAIIARRDNITACYLAFRGAVPARYPVLRIKGRSPEARCGPRLRAI